MAFIAKDYSLAKGKLVDIQRMVSLWRPRVAGFSSCDVPLLALLAWGSYIPCWQHLPRHIQAWRTRHPSVFVALCGLGAV